MHKTKKGRFITLQISLEADESAAQALDDQIDNYQAAGVHSPLSAEQECDWPVSSRLGDKCLAFGATKCRDKFRLAYRRH